MVFFSEGKRRWLSDFSFVFLLLPFYFNNVYFLQTMLFLILLFFVSSCLFVCLCSERGINISLSSFGISRFFGRQREINRDYVVHCCWQFLYLLLQLFVYFTCSSFGDCFCPINWKCTSQFMKLLFWLVCCYKSLYAENRYSIAPESDGIFKSDLCTQLTSQKNEKRNEKVLWVFY